MKGNVIIQDLTLILLLLNEVAGMFGVSSYGVVGWACNWVRVKMDRDKRFRKKVEEIRNKTYKQKI